MPTPEEITKDLIEKVRAGGDTGSAVLLGYLTNSPGGKKRLYLNLEFTEFVEFKSDDLVHSLHLATETNPLGAVVVWVRGDAQITYTNTSPNTVVADFMNGPISARFMTMGEGPGTLGWPTPDGIILNTRIVNCTMPCTFGCSGGMGCDPNASNVCTRSTLCTCKVVGP
jgi:hypothetical protein